MAIEFAPQCCDALHYLNISAQCAQSGVCYDPLRPMGVVLWFAIPYWLGLPPQSILYAHWCLLICSVLLAAWSMTALLASLRASRTGVMVGGALLVVSVLAHWVFFRPVLHNSLADPPAALFILLALWALVISALRARPSWPLTLFAGLCLGLATWLRAFYLYPMLGALSLTLLAWAWRPKQRKAFLGLTLALIPVLIQYTATYRTTGDISFLSRQQTEQWTALHLSDVSRGYDTLIPASGHRWGPACVTELGPLDSLKAGRVWDAACLYGGRVDFYLGSYAKDTYILHDYHGMLVLNEEIGHSGRWGVEQLTVELDAGPAPDGSMTAERLVVTNTDPQGAGSVFSWANNVTAGEYTFSVWLWSDLPRTLRIGLYRPEDTHLFAAEEVTLSPEPRRYSVTARFEPRSPSELFPLLGVKIGKIGDAPVTMGTVEGDWFYAWGSRLERSPHMKEFSTENPPPNRIWSRWLLGANVLSIIGGLLLLIRNRRRFGAEVWVLAVLPGLCFGQAIVIVPEQRFVIVVQVVAWMLCATALIGRLVGGVPRQRA